jgi:hypothetical protein
MALLVLGALVDRGLPKTETITPLVATEAVPALNQEVVVRVVTITPTGDGFLLILLAEQVSA